MSPVLPGAGLAIVPFALAATGMTLVDLLVLRSVLPGGKTEVRLSSAVFVAYYLGVSVAFFALLAVAFTDRGVAASGFLVLGLMAMMSAGGMAGYLLFSGAGEGAIRAGWGWPLALASLLTAAELSMAWAFSVGLGGTNAFGGPSSLYALLDGALACGTSGWFLWPMALTMVLLVAWTPLEPVERRALLGLALTSMAGPWIVSDPTLAEAALSVGMGVTVLSVLPVARAPRARAESLRAVLLVLAGFLAMIPGEAVLSFRPNLAWAAWPFAIAMIAVMLAEATLLLAGGRALGVGLRRAPSPLAEDVAGDEAPPGSVMPGGV